MGLEPGYPVVRSNDPSQQCGDRDVAAGEAQPGRLGLTCYRISVTSLIAPRTMPKPTCLRQARR